MKEAKRAIFEVESVAAIETDLATARNEGRVEAVLFHLEELGAVHLHTENELLQKRCAKLICQDQRQAA